MYFSAVYSGVERYVAFDPNRGLRLGYAKLLQLGGMHLENCDRDTLSCGEGFQVHSLPFEVGSSKLQVDAFISSVSCLGLYMYSMNGRRR